MHRPRVLNAVFFPERSLNFLPELLSLLPYPFSAYLPYTLAFYNPTHPQHGREYFHFPPRQACQAPLRR